MLLVEHDLDLVRRADWLVDVGPGAGGDGGRVLHSGPVAGLSGVPGSATRPYLDPARRLVLLVLLRRERHLRRVRREIDRELDV